MYVKTNVERTLAAEICDSFLGLDVQLNELLRQSQTHLVAEDFCRLRKSVGDILGIMYVDIVKNIYECHPDLKPQGMP